LNLVVAPDGREHGADVGVAERFVNVLGSQFGARSKRLRVRLGRLEDNWVEVEAVAEPFEREVQHVRDDGRRTAGGRDHCDFVARFGGRWRDERTGTGAVAHTVTVA